MEQEGRTLFGVKSMQTTSQFWSKLKHQHPSVLEMKNAADRNEDLGERAGDAMKVTRSLQTRQRGMAAWLRYVTE